jgi:hypothetical protein
MRICRTTERVRVSNDSVFLVIFGTPDGERTERYISE